MKVAIFDFDRTLFPEETFPLLMKHLKTHPKHSRKYRYFISRILPVYAAYKCKLYPETKMKDYSMRCYISSFGSAPKTDIEQFFSELGGMMSKNLSEPVLKRLEQHRKDGYYIMIVSGAFEPLLNSVMKGIHFDSIIGTSISFDNKKGRHLPLEYIHGIRKKEVIHKKLASMDVDWENSFAYGDSYSDLSVLELVGNPVAVKPEPRLIQVANKRKWEVIM